MKNNMNNLKDFQNSFIFIYSNQINQVEKYIYQFNYKKGVNQCLKDGIWIDCLDVNDPDSFITTQITKISRESSDAE